MLDSWPIWRKGKSFIGGTYQRLGPSDAEGSKDHSEVLVLNVARRLEEG